MVLERGQILEQVTRDPTNCQCAVSMRVRRVGSRMRSEYLQSSFGLPCSFQTVETEYTCYKRLTGQTNVMCAVCQPGVQTSEIHQICSS